MTLLTSNSNMSLIILLMRNAATHTSPPGYAAFISYRHLPRDAEVACEVQRAIEEYRAAPTCRADAPSLSFPQTRQMLSRRGRACGFALAALTVFRKRWRLRARFIVICSPETRESSWVRREIEMFEQLHGRERIICVLAAGSPEESILPILKTRLIPDASGVLREMPAEPLAADLRPEAKAKRKAELLRIIAAVAGCSYDDLRQRERARKPQAHCPRVRGSGPHHRRRRRLRLPISPNQRGGAHRGIEEPRRPALDQYAQGETAQAIETALQASPLPRATLAGRSSPKPKPPSKRF